MQINKEFHEEEQDKQEKKRNKSAPIYYVYALSDDKGVFYIGSGTQSRIYNSKSILTYKGQEAHDDMIDKEGNIIIPYKKDSAGNPILPLEPLEHEERAEPTDPLAIEQSAKRKRIRSAKARGVKVFHNVLYAHTDRQAVYAAEQSAINLFGDWLTNVRQPAITGYKGDGDGHTIPPSLPFTIGRIWQPYKGREGNH